jgi:glycogen(starch) synthase
MHIALLTPSYPPLVDGGVAIATGRLATQLTRLGHRVTVITAEPSDARFVPDTKQRQDAPDRTAGLSIHYRFVSDPLRAHSAVTDLCRWAKGYHRQLPFDAVLAYFVYPGGYLGTMLGENLGVPVVCSCRGNDISKNIFIDAETVAWVLRRSTRLIFVCDSLLRMADTLVPCRDKAAVVPNAVDSDLFRPAAHRRAEATHVVLGTSGVMRWKKGVDLFLPLIHRLCTEHDIRVLIAGYGLDAETDCRIADFLRRHALEHQVELSGPIAHRKIVEVLQQLDVYLNTSYQEGMPNGVLEAMACGLPVVATDADGTTALVQDGVSGYLCRMGDLDALTACCKRLIDQPVLRRRMGHAGRQRVLRDFQPAREAEAVEAVLQRALRAI